MAERRPKKMAKRAAKKEKMKFKQLQAVLPDQTRYYRPRLTCHLLKLLPGSVLPHLTTPVLPHMATPVYRPYYRAYYRISQKLLVSPGSNPVVAPVVARYYRKSGTTGLPPVLPLRANLHAGKALLPCNLKNAEICAAAEMQ